MPQLPMDDAAAVAYLRQQVIRAGGEAAWAKPRGITGAAVSNILSGRRHIGPRIARALGLRITRQFVSDHRAAYQGAASNRRPTMSSTAIVKLTYPHNDDHGKVDTLCADPEYQRDFLAAVEAVGQKHGAKHGLHLTGPVIGKLLDVSHS